MTEGSELPSGTAMSRQLWPLRFVQVDHRHCRPTANETMLGLRRVVGTEVVQSFFLGLWEAPQDGAAKGQTASLA